MMSAYGIMFHHFHDDQHPRVQGSISASDLVELIDHIGRDKILRPDEWMRRALKGNLRDNDICLTFDDALRCQYDIAFPVLRDMGLTAFWFVYSSVFEGNIEPLEVYRYFRTTSFDCIDDFYNDFFQLTKNKFHDEYVDKLRDFRPDSYLAAFPFYTTNDRIFRYLRDDVLGPERYHLVMGEMLAASGFNGGAIAKQLWMTDEHLLNLHDEGHLIGLHSYSHPTRLAELSRGKQREEYRKNLEHLLKVLDSPPECMAHPCNSYDPETLRLLEELGIRLGFRANMQEIVGHSDFEFPREDHANIMKNMRP
jgi:peptidoglycan/xylan/chitin deacetylase (PgdA/CDA1 family)